MRLNTQERTVVRSGNFAEEAGTQERPFEVHLPNLIVATIFILRCDRPATCLSLSLLEHARLAPAETT